MRDNDVLNIGEKLRAARRKQKLSLRELASRADVSPSLLSQIENGRANPSVMTLYNVAGALAVPITFFFPDLAANQTDGQQTLVMQSDKTASEHRSDVHGGFNMPEPPVKSPVVQRDSRAAIELMGGVRWERLTAAEEEDIQFLEIEYEPGASSGVAMSRHNGREFGMVLEGTLKLELGFEEHMLGPGDSIIFDSMTPHRLSNEGSSPVRAIWVLMNRGG